MSANQPLHLQFFTLFKDLPTEILSPFSIDSSSHLVSPSVDKARIGQNIERSAHSNTSNHSLQRQQLYQYKSSRQSYLFECLQYYEKLIKEEQSKRDWKNSSLNSEKVIRSNTQEYRNENRRYSADDTSSSTSSVTNPSINSDTKKRSTSVPPSPLPHTNFTEEPVIPQWSMDLTHWKGDRRVVYTLLLGSAYLDCELFGEAHYWFMAARTLCQEIISSQSFDPYLEFLYIESDTQLAITFLRVQRISEAVQYLEISYHRIVNFLSTFLVSNVEITEDDLRFSVIMLYIKTLTQAALIQSNDDQLLFPSILPNLNKSDTRDHLVLKILQKSLKLFILLTKRNNNSYSNGVRIGSNHNQLDSNERNTTEFFISNFHHRKTIIHMFYLISKHLNQLNFDMLAYDYLNKIIQITNETLLNGNKMHNSINNLSQQLKKSSKTQKHMIPAKQQSKLSILSQFTEDNSDDDDWSCDDDDDEEEGLTARLQNKKISIQKSSSSIMTSINSTDNSKDTGKKQVSSKDILKDSIFPDNYRFFKSRDSIDVPQERNTISSSFFSLHLIGGKKKFENVKEHIDWLNLLVSRHQIYQDSIISNDNLIVNNFIDDLPYLDEFSIAWALKHYETCEKLVSLNTSNSLEHCHDILTRFFTELPNAKMTENIDVDDLKNYVGLFNIGIELLRIAALTTFTKNRKQFDEMIKNLQNFYPKYSDYVTLISIEAQCHNGDNNGDIIGILLTIYEKYHTVPTIVSSTLTQEKDEYIRTDASIKKSFQVPKTLYHIQSGFELACHSVLILHLYLSNISPITRASLKFQSLNSETIGLNFLSENNMMDVSHRIQVLENLYQKIFTLSPLKGRAALALGSYYRQVNRNLKVAERLLFESVFIFDQVSSTSILEKKPPILSTFGLAAMNEYAECLLENHKYSLASPCFDSIVQANSVIGKPNFKLINRLAVLSSKNNDWNRSLKYIYMLLEKAKEDRNISSVAFLSERLSRECMERGDFRNAEYYITQCVEFIEFENQRNKGKRESLNDTTKTDLELNLQLKLAHLFLQGYYFEKGIDLLAKLIDQQLTPIQKCQVLLELSEAYLKKRWLKECEIILEKLVKHLQIHQILLGNSEVFDHVTMLQIASRLYFRKGQFSLSIFCVNIAMEQCDSSQLPRFADLFRLKGKIFHSISKTTSSITFPTSLDVGDAENKQSYPIISLFKSLNPRSDKGNQFFDRSFLGKRDIYKSSSEALFDALKYYETSAFFYNAINDYVNMTRIHLLISQAQIEYLFTSLSFLQCRRTLKFLNNEFPDQEFAIDFSSIENQHLIPALDVSVNSTSILLAMDSYITSAELRFLQGRKISSQEFWTECLHVIFTLFMKETNVVVRKGAPPGFLEKIFNIVKRLVRLLFCFHKQFINDNIVVVDSLLLLERELLQALKRHNDYESWISIPYDFDGSISGTSSTSSTSSVSTGSLSTDAETVSHLIRQNKVYQALPCNHSLSKTKSIPFLRRKKKKGSTKKLSLSSISSLKLKMTSKSVSSATSSSINDETLTVNERVNERIWGCFFRMKQHQRKYSSQNITQQELSRRNQETMRRLWHLMKALREKGDDIASTQTTEDEKESSLEYIDMRIRHLSVTSADNLVVNCLYKTIGNQKRFKQEKHKKGERQPSLQTDISYIKWTNQIVDENLLRQLVYIIRLDDIIVYYLPITGEKKFQKFGGREVDGDNCINWIENEINEFIHSVLTQGRRKKMKVGEDDVALNQLSKLFKEAPFHYSAEYPFDIESSHNFNINIQKSTKIPNLKKMTPSILQSLTTKPLYLIISHHLQMIPWESLFTQFATRYFTLQSVIERKRQNISLSEAIGIDTANPTHSESLKSKPCFFMFYSEDESQFIMPLERDRKSWIYDDLIHELNLFPNKEKPCIVHDILPNLPLHAPVIKYGKKPKSKSYRQCYKPINFIQLSRIAQNTHNIFTHIESHLNQNQFPVFIFSFGDLIDLSECIHYLFAHRKDCAHIFIPEKYMIYAVKTLCNIQKSFTNSDSEHVFSGFVLNQSIQWLRKMLHIPIISVNAPE